LHFAWSKKGDIFSLSGDIIRPLIYALIIIIFLIFRIPSVRRWLASLSFRRLIPASKKNQQPKADAS
jgi:DMSO/TMAO reductase YedYZ heme-binding membrane subunit